MTGTDLKLSKMVRKCSGNGQYMARKWSKLVSKCTGNVQEICRKGQEIVGKTSNGQERVQNAQEMFMKCQKMDQDVRQTVRKCLRNG